MGEPEPRNNRASGSARNRAVGKPRPLGGRPEAQPPGRTLQVRRFAGKNSCRRNRIRAAKTVKEGETVPAPAAVVAVVGGDDDADKDESRNSARPRNFARRPARRATIATV